MTPARRMWRATFIVGMVAASSLAPFPARAGEPPPVEATPPACAAAAPLLTAVASFRARDLDATHRDVDQLAQAIGPGCRRAIEERRWPALARALLDLESARAGFRDSVCELAPPEAATEIARWETAAEIANWEAQETRSGGWDAPCALALLRLDPAAFDRVAAPRFAQVSGCWVPVTTRQLAERMAPRERARLLPALAAATRARVNGRDDLFALVCGDEKTKAAPECRTEPRLEPRWALIGRFRRALGPAAVHLVLAATYVLAYLLAWRAARPAWRGGGSAAIGGAVTAGLAAWIVGTESTPGAGSLDALNIVVGAVATPIAAAAGALFGWIMVKLVTVPPLPWCTFQTVIYLAMALVHTWNQAPLELPC